MWAYLAGVQGVDKFGSLKPGGHCDHLGRETKPDLQRSVSIAMLYAIMFELLLWSRGQADTVLPSTSRQSVMNLFSKSLGAEDKLVNKRHLKNEKEPPLCEWKVALLYRR